MRTTAMVLATTAVLATGGCGADGRLAPWRLAGPPPDPAATSVDILVSEQGCTGGQLATARIQEPEVSYERDRIIVIVRTSEAGINTCPSNPETPYVLRLDEPVGDRVLMDGSLEPPAAPATVPPTHRPR